MRPSNERSRYRDLTHELWQVLDVFLKGPQQHPLTETYPHCNHNQLFQQGLSYTCLKAHHTHL